MSKANEGSFTNGARHTHEFTDDHVELKVSGSFFINSDSSITAKAIKTDQELQKVAERYGFEIKFDSENPGFKWIDNNGDMEHLSVGETIEWAFSNRKAASKSKSLKKPKLTRNKFSNLTESDWKETNEQSKKDQGINGVPNEGFKEI